MKQVLSASLWRGITMLTADTLSLIYRLLVSSTNQRIKTVLVKFFEKINVIM